MAIGLGRDVEGAGWMMCVGGGVRKEEKELDCGGFWKGTEVRWWRWVLVVLRKVVCLL